jgi:tellurite methyltransferase
MQRPMRGFHQDAESHWVAELSCGHAQHVRHQPPFTLRPWMLTLEGRTGRLGQSLDCVACDRRELPQGYAPYKQTPVFTQATVPAGLLRQHELEAGVWAFIHVVSGTLEYAIAGEHGAGQIVRAGERAVVLPEIEHRVAPLGEVAFFVEFWRREPS